ncbi:hypothetical protein L227DRAFT_606699 [Lentinus tigrinus ALCF2SS1-6]|uniref:Uncharacterized protein n=1 Tax=Lentinus tigrinus ALCF2SS1-6 TaxID=1328759 RepID=A0A5C2ST55_9APHY|nr:hypothetical protein L227DRAFT_606699 [Lentinus tigrinus ALCF2SS1-6]
MSYDSEPPGRRIPTLVQHCQRVACAHVEILEKAGGMISLDPSWRAARQILFASSSWPIQYVHSPSPRYAAVAVTVFSKYIANETADIWKALFLKQYPIEAHRYESDAMEEPESWRDIFFAARDREQQRLNQLSVKLKASRQEEEERKRESAIKLTDRAPPAKRARPWGAPSQPRSLFQRARIDTVRMQKNVFTQSTRPSFQRQRIVPNSVSAKPPPPSSSASTSAGPPVVVRQVAVMPKPSQSKPSKTTYTKTTNAVPIHSPSTPAARLASSPPPPPSSPPAPSSPPDFRSPPSRGPPKKNPASSLFMPKHRAYSQVPRGVQSKS